MIFKILECDPFNLLLLFGHEKCSELAHLAEINVKTRKKSEQLD